MKTQAVSRSADPLGDMALAISKTNTAARSTVVLGLSSSLIPQSAKTEGEPNGARLLFKGINFDDIIDQLWLLFDEFRIFDRAFADSYHVD